MNRVLEILSLLFAMNFILTVLFAVLSSSDYSSAEVVISTCTPERENADRILLSTLYRSKVLHSPIHRFKVISENGMPNGEKSQSKNVQDFHTLRDQCLQNKQLGLFEDPEFEAVDSSIYYDKTKSEEYSEIVWLRPHSITKRPKFIVQRGTRFDIRQGNGGDCWFLAVAAELPYLNKTLFSHIVPTDQGFDDKNYCGIFHFRFWQVGRWVDVVIDDRLPTIYNENENQTKLFFAQSTKDDEYWVALLEKAYAKLYGSYDALNGGQEIEAMEDLTGGVAIMFDLNKLLPVPDLFQIMKKCMARQSLITTGMNKEFDDKEKILKKKGLFSGHSYSVTDVQYVNVSFSNKTNRVPLVRVRNPWGHSEWNGPWSDDAQEWNLVSKQEKKKLRVKNSDDGEYWMSYKDFVNMFDEVSICMINPSILSENPQDSRIRWEVSVVRGEWIRSGTAGGCSEATLHENPQYQIELKDPDDDSQLCTVFIGLMQESQRALRNFIKEEYEQYLPTGFVIYKVENSSSTLHKPFNSDYIQRNKWFETSKFYQEISREVTHRFEVPPGVYCIIPCTQHSDVEGEFILRVVTEKKNTMKAL